MKQKLFFIAIVAVFIGLFQLSWSPTMHTNFALGEDTTISPAAARLLPGLVVSFQNAKGETVDAHEARLIALRVPAGSAVSPMIDGPGWSATWTGMVTTKIKDTYTFAAAGKGDLTVTINDKPVMELHGEFDKHPTEPVLIHKGKTRLVVVYHPPADGEANVRLMWAASGALLEPITPAVFVHDSSDDLLMKHQAARVGRELLATMRCSACHQGIDGTLPELKQDAPNLSQLKQRLNFTWTANWISNPRALRPTADMPRVFHDRSDGIDPRAIDIAAYLTESDSPVTPASDAPLLARGARLFTGLGCVACHVGPGVVDSDPTLNRVPLKYVRSKFKTGALVEFLHKPEAHFAWIKMPNFHLSDGEATALASWLIASCPVDALPPVTAHGDAENGKKLFATSGCLNCHATDQPTQHAVNGGELSGTNADRGCLADQVNKGVDFGFTPDQLQSLRAFVASNWKPTLQRDPPAEFATRQMSALRCTACHSMDAQDSAWSNLDSEIAGIEQNLPPRGDDDPQPKGEQARPPLTWTGEKLQPGWMASFIAGKISYKPRPWLFARMPSFASRADLLSQGLALSHGCPATDELRPPVDAKLAEVGKQLVAQTGLGCVKCHAVADQAALAPFEAEAPNFAHVEARLRHDYFTHWMRNPQYFLPKTKMPSFADANGQTALKDILSGDATAEYEAIWNYLRAGEKIAPVQ